MWRALVVGATACSFVHGAAVSSDSSSGSDGSRDAAKELPPPDATPAPFALTGMQWSIPCVEPFNTRPTACVVAQTSPSYTNTVQLAGSASEHWLVTAQVAGAVEALQYANGSANGEWYVGGDTGGDTGDNYYEITVSSPAQHYYLNNGAVGATNSMAADYSVQLPIDGDATVTFAASPQDMYQWQGVDATDRPIAIAGYTAPPPVAGMYGQWAYFTVTQAQPQ